MLDTNAPYPNSSVENSRREKGQRLLTRKIMLSALPEPGDEPISAAAVRAKIVSTGLEVDANRVATMLCQQANSGRVERFKAGKFCSWRKAEAGMSAPKRSAHARQGDEPKTRVERQRSIFAANLNRRMEELKLTQADVARAVWRETHADARGYQQPKGRDRMSAYCLGRALPVDATLAKLAKVLKTTPEALLGDSVRVSVPAPKTSDEREHFAFTWDSGVSITIDLKAVFPEAAGREIAALIAKHLPLAGTE